MVTDAQAQAVAATANATGKVVDLVHAAGGYVASTVGTIPEDLLGIVGGDWINEQRRRNRARMQAKTQAILDGVDPSRRSEPSASVVVPLLQSAADEGREALQDVWAALLARSMMDDGRGVRRAYFEAVREMEPLDVLVLRHAAANLDAASWTSDQLSLMMEIEQNELDVAVAALVQIGCVRKMGNQNWGMTPFGLELIRLCEPDEPS